MKDPASLSQSASEIQSPALCLEQDKWLSQEGQGQGDPSPEGSATIDAVFGLPASQTPWSEVISAPPTMRAPART